MEKVFKILLFFLADIQITGTQLRKNHFAFGDLWLPDAMPICLGIKFHIQLYLTILMPGLVI